MTYDIKCSDCGRYLATTDKGVSLQIKCSNSKCKSLKTYNIVFMSEHLTHNHEKVTNAKQ